MAESGTFNGPRLHGEVLPGGGDWLVLRGQDAVARYLAGETLRSTDMDACTSPLFETGAHGYTWLNGTSNIGFVDLTTRSSGCAPAAKRCTAANRSAPLDPRLGTHRRAHQPKPDPGAPLVDPKE